MDYLMLNGYSEHLLETSFSEVLNAFLRCNNIEYTQ